MAKIILKNSFEGHPIRKICESLFIRARSLIRRRCALTIQTENAKMFEADVKMIGSHERYMKCSLKRVRSTKLKIRHEKIYTCTEGPHTPSLVGHRCFQRLMLFQSLSHAKISSLLNAGRNVCYLCPLHPPQALPQQLSNL